MRFMTTLVLATVLAAPAMAQTAVTPATPSQPAVHHPMRHHAPARHKAMGEPRATDEDKGPFTPEANRAYDSGGTILEGAPGGPPPPASAVLSTPQGRPLPPPMR